MPRKKLMLVSSAIIDTFYDYNLGVGYSHTHKAHRFYSIDTDLFVQMKGNKFEAIGQALRWFCENRKYLDRMWYSNCDKLKDKYEHWRYER